MFVTTLFIMLHIRGGVSTGLNLLDLLHAVAGTGPHFSLWHPLMTLWTVVNSLRQSLQKMWAQNICEGTASKSVTVRVDNCTFFNIYQWPWRASINNTVSSSAVSFIWFVQMCSESFIKAKVVVGLSFAHLHIHWWWWKNIKHTKTLIISIRGRYPDLVLL